MRFAIAFVRARRVPMVFGITGLITAASAGLAGCGTSDSLPKLEVHEVKGTVVLADGKPLTGGSIYFVRKAGDLPVTPSGKIGPDGSFSLVTGGSGEGAPAGEYKVRIEAAPVGSTGQKTKEPFPARYNDEDSSKIEITVRAGANQLEPIRLK
jgi:hypothetical protein